MGQYLDLKVLKEELLALLERYELRPKIVILGLVLPKDQFDAVATDHPNHKPPGVLQTGDRTNPNLQWGISIQRERKVEDFPPGVILTPPD